MSDLDFLKKYEDLLNKDYCNCNEMNCIDNNSPRRILNIAKNQQKEIERLQQENILIKSSNKLVSDKLQDYKSRCNKAIGRISLLKMDDITIETNKALDYVLKSLNGSDDK